MTWLCLPFQSDMYLYHHALHDSGVAWVFLRAGQKTAEADACLLSAVAGTRLAGILNQVADKIIFPFVYPDEAKLPYSWAFMGLPARLPW